MARVNVEAARALYPSCDMGVEQWTAFFDTPAGLQAFGKITYDIYDELKSQEEKNAGLRRIGRRPQRSAVPLDEIMGIIYPEEFSNEPLRERIRPYIKNQRAFAKRANIHQSTLSRILTGDMNDLSIEMMESIARACNLRPWVFPEWRAVYVGQLITEVMLMAPHMGIRVVKGLRERRAKHEGVRL